MFDFLNLLENAKLKNYRIIRECQNQMTQPEKSVSFSYEPRCEKTGLWGF